MAEDDEPMQMMPFIEPPDDLHELYMYTRAELSTVRTMYQYYMKLILLVDIGKEMLPSHYDDLRAEAENFLGSKKSYPEPRQMEEIPTGYRMGTGTSSTGLVRVRQDDLNIAVDEVREQQATALVPNLKRLDSKIFSALVASNIIDIKKPTMEDILMEDIMLDIQQKIREIEEGEEDG